MKYTNMKLSFSTLLSSMCESVCIFITVAIYLSDIKNVQEPQLYTKWLGLEQLVNL
jgi:hypothetical protein